MIALRGAMRLSPIGPPIPDGDVLMHGCSPFRLPSKAASTDPLWGQAPAGSTARPGTIGQNRPVVPLLQSGHSHSGNKHNLLFKRYCPPKLKGRCSLSSFHGFLLMPNSDKIGKVSDGAAIGHIGSLDRRTASRDINLFRSK